MNLIKNASNFIKKNADVILTIGSVAGTIGTAFIFSKAAIKTEKTLEDIRDGDFTTKQKIKMIAPNYILPGGVLLTTITCIIGAQAINANEKRCLIAGYSAAMASFSSYKNAVIEKYGRDSHNQIIDDIMKKRVDISKTIVYNPNCFDADSSSGYENDWESEILFYDQFSDLYFETKLSKVLQAEYALNRNFALRGCVTLDEFYDLLGLNVPLEPYNTLGWTMEDGIAWIDFSHEKEYLDDGTLECCVLNIVFPPDFLNGVDLK